MPHGEGFEERQDPNNPKGLLCNVSYTIDPFFTNKFLAENVGMSHLVKTGIMQRK